ncbi:MAG: FHA domain-containing protein [Rhodoglobus sp.]
MDEDLDDTVVAPPRVVATDRYPVDLDDTVIRRPGQSMVDEPSPAARGMPARTAPGIHSFVVNGTAYRLDVPAIIGRNPRGPRVPTGESLTLIAVASATNEVSSSHVEIRQRGTNVVVTDLRSTNGTSVSIPLSQPRRLRPSESIVVSPGSLIDIGDGTIIHILPITAPTRQEGNRD